MLGDELGIDPSDELRDLEEAILLHKPDLDWTLPPSHRAPGVPSNLPAERSVFVGRRQELSTIAGLVRSARLVTLTGVGGVGKTRLALQTAAGLVGEFPSGVWLVELAPLIDSALVAATVASALGVSPAGGVDSTEAVCRFLAQRRALVVLDNCEHVIGAAAALVDRILAAGPQVRVLATSREPLDIAGESPWRVPSLSLDGDADALALFAERAAQAQPGLSSTDPATAESAVAVCRRLDGIPLAIELAAARAKVLSVDQIAAHLDERFRLLTGGGRTAVPRQQTLQGAIGWSYDLLTARNGRCSTRSACSPGSSTWMPSPPSPASMRSRHWTWSSNWSTSRWSRPTPPATAIDCWKPFGSTCGSGSLPAGASARCATPTPASLRGVGRPAGTADGRGRPTRRRARPARRGVRQPAGRAWPG